MLSGMPLKTIPPFFLPVYFNKLRGLQHLQNLVKGITGVAVLPYRVYGHPREFDPAHFPGAPRLLVRADVNASNSYRLWRSLPRGECDDAGSSWVMLQTGKPNVVAQSSGDLLAKMHAAASALVAPGQNLRYIIHPTVPRRELLIHGVLSPNEQGFDFLKLYPAYPDVLVWRASQGSHAGVELMSKDERHLEYGRESMRCWGLTKSESGSVMGRLLEVDARILAASSEIKIRPHDSIETAFAIRRVAGKPLVEFFDMLLEPPMD